MGDVQIYIHALRNGNYFKILDLVVFVNDKYNLIKQGDLLGNDELQQLVIYELCQTDIGGNDIEAINFLFNYITYHQTLAFGIEGFAMMSFLTSAAVAIAINQDALNKKNIAGTVIENARELKNFLKPTSNFSILIDMVQDRLKNLLEVISASCDDEMLLNKIMDMDNEVFRNFQSEVLHIQSQRYKEGILFECCLIQAKENTMPLATELMDIVEPEESDSLPLLIELLDNYERKRRSDMEYHLFDIGRFGFSKTEKQDAVRALKHALDGGADDLAKYLKILRNGQLGETIRRFLKKTDTSSFLGENVSTVSELVACLSLKNTGECLSVNVALMKY